MVVTGFFAQCHAMSTSGMDNLIHDITVDYAWHGEHDGMVIMAW